jgi:hypothetical protein
VCGTKNFVSVRLYSAPQSHWTIVSIFGICAFGEPVQAGSFAAIKSDPDTRQPPDSDALSLRPIVEHGKSVEHRKRAA